MKLKTAALIGSLFAAVSSNAAEQPNVIFILIDDLNQYGMPAYGAETVSAVNGEFKPTKLESPAIDRLAKSGIRCEQAYTYPICEPTRVALLSGMHNGRNFVYPKAIHESQITISDVFKRAGYVTGMFGKWKQSRGTKAIPGNRYISEFGWDEYCCFDVVDEGRRFIEPNLVVNGKITDLTGMDPETGRRWYGPDVVNRAALKFLDDHKDDPFFLYYPLMLVHDEHTPTPDTEPKSAYDDFDLHTKVAEWMPYPGDDRKYFPDMLRYMDKLVGKILTKLDELGLRENTLVVIMGDNGAKECFEFTAKDGSKRIGRKGHSRDGGEHVGLIFSWPGKVPAGKSGEIRTYEGLVDIVDIYPTLAEACGIEIPGKELIDGISAWPQISGKKTAPDRQFIYHWFNGNRPMSDTSKAIEYAFTADFKRYAPHDKYADGRFFDLRTDIEEEAGEKGRELFWHNWFFSGLDVNQLTAEQNDAYEMLGRALDSKKYIPVEGLQIVKDEAPIRVGDTRKLKVRMSPQNATRNNVVWESSDPAVASINKFGELTAHEKGRVDITVYSWDDALPASNNKDEAFKRDGIKDTIQLSIGQ